MTPRRVLLISHKHPWPADDGKKAVLAGFVAYLVERFGADSVTYVIVGRPPVDPAPMPCQVVWLPPPSRLAQALQGLASLVGLRQSSLQEAVTGSPALQRRLAALCQAREPCLVLMDTIRVGQCLETPRPGQQRVLYMDDLFHLRFARMLAMSGQGRASVAAVGTFGALLPAPARALLAAPWLRNLLYRIEMRKVRGRELRAPACFDLCLLINPHEAALLRDQGQPGRVEAVKPLLFPGPSPRHRCYDGQAEFVLFGSLRHPLYRASVLRFLDTAMPALVTAMPDLRLRIVGEGADDAVRSACARLGEHVTLLGFVDDIAPLFTRACALLVPSIAGGGLRLKAVTAMHHGLPIISTTEGVDGIPLVDGESLLREDDILRFGAAMRRLREPAFNQVISTAAHAVFQAHYGRDAVFRDYDVLFAPGAGGGG
jgi:hypothetical protein